MWPEKISDQMCGWNANEIVGISLAQMLLYAALAGMMMGILSTLAVQFLWNKLCKVFSEVAEPEVAAQTAITDVEEKEDLTETLKDPESVEVHFHSRSCSVTREEVLDPRWAPAWAAAQRTQEVHSSSCSSDSEGYVRRRGHRPRRHHGHDLGQIE